MTPARAAAIWILITAVAGAALAEEPVDGVTLAPSEAGLAAEDAAGEGAGERATPTASDASLLRADWSFTAIGQYTHTESPDDRDDVGGFFDQYEFTPNKGSDFPFQLGIRSGALDLLRGPDQSAVFQARLWSPTSNLGVSGDQVDDPFFNQRLEALTRLDGIELDLEYRRMRTEQLRIYPNTEGPGQVFNDQSRRGDRFFRDRTGFSVEGRVRPYEALDGREAEGSWMRPELSLRGGYQSREARRQIRTQLPGTNTWIGLGEHQESSVGDAGGGVLVAPDGLLTLSFDFDYEQLRLDDPVLTQGELGFPPPGAASRAIDFVPETDRYTGSVRFNSRLGDSAVVEGGFLVSELEQVSEYTPDQRNAGLQDNRVRYYGANAAVDVALRDDLSFNAFFKFDRRENDIERDTPLFNEDNQVNAFTRSWQRFFVGGELELEYWSTSRAGLGLKFEDVSRDRDFAAAGRRILRPNSLYGSSSRIVTLYGRSSARPWRRLRLEAELGYRWAPETGYATELDDNLYGELRASYVFAFSRPLLVSAYLRGGTGDNDDFTMVSGLGPDPAGARLRRHYERSHFVTGVTASLSPVERLSLTASFFYARDDQDSTLDFSDLPRYWQDVAPIGFGRNGHLRFENKQLSLVLGTHVQLTQQTDASFSYSFTRADADYSGSDATAALELVADNSRIDSNTHVLDFELRHRIVAGFEVLAGYRFQDQDDDGPVPVSVASVVEPRNQSAEQHTVTVGVTLTSEFFER